MVRCDLLHLQQCVRPRRRLRRNLLRRKPAALLSLVIATGVGSALCVPSLVATAAPQPPSKSHAQQSVAHSDDVVSPLEEKRRALRQAAISEVLNGTAKPVKRGASTVVRLSSATASKAVNRRGATTRAAVTTDQYVELSREKTDKIFVVLAEFGNTRDPKYPDKDIDPTTPGPVTWNGPLH